jgi:TetR/AcrR family transcriptional regulator, cholesterol catabolism regulator
MYQSAHITNEKIRATHYIFFTQLSFIKNLDEYESIVIKRNEIFNVLIYIIREGQMQKQFRGDIHPKILAFLIVGMINWFYQWYNPDGPRSIEKITEDVNLLAFEGIKKK